MNKVLNQDDSEGPVSFESRIAGAALLTAAAVLVAACVAFIAEQWRAERVILDRTHAAVASMLATDAADAVAKGDAQETQRVFAALKPLKRISSADLTDAKGRVLASYHRAEVERRIHTTDVWKAPVKVGGADVGQVVVRADRFTVVSILPRYLAVAFALFFAAAGIALVVGRFLAKRITQPVARLSAAMAEITGGAGDYDARVEPMYNDEVGKLTVAFNNLLGRLQVNDLMLRQTMDELVDARDAAEAANVLKSHFLANMSHEIRTPLNGVLAMAQIMAMGELAPKQRERLAVIQNSGESLLTVLNDILDLSKIEAGRMEIDQTTFEIGALARETFAGFSGLASEKGLAFALEIDPEADGWRRGDPTRVRQILGNLISNALKFTAKGEVKVKLDAWPAGEGITLSVCDTGPGIPEDKLALLFEKFSQVDGSSTRQHGGTGLGLAICRELAHLMGGTVGVDSRVGEGSTFYVRLPLEVAADQGQTAAAEPTGECEAVAEDRPMRVLAAEDNATNQLVLRTILQIFEADLTLVPDGAQAVEAWTHGNFDLVLMDIQMPVMDGVAATRAIRAAEKAQSRPHTPIIAVSANAMAHQVKEYLAAGMDAHVPKPIELAKLHTAMAEALGRAEQGQSVAA